MAHYIMSFEVDRYNHPVYESDHRAGSRANYDDAWRTLWRKYRRGADRMRIVAVTRSNYDGVPEGPTVDVRRFSA